MRFMSLIRSTLAVVLTVSTFASAGINVDGNDVITKPGKQLEDSGLKYAAVSKRIIVPSVELRLLWASQSFAAAKGVHARLRHALSGLEKADAQALAQSVYDDFVAKLRAQGWEVLTYDDIKADVSDLARWEPAADLGLPLWNDPNTADSFAIATPSDEQAFKPALQGPTWAFRKVAKEKDATIFYPVFRVYSPRPRMTAVEKSDSSNVSVYLNPFLAFIPNSMQLWTFNAKGAGGIVKNTEFFRTSENAGVVEAADENSPEFKGKISWFYKNVVAGNSDAGVNKSRSKLVVFKVDKAAYTAAVLKGTGAFADIVARASAAHVKK